MKATLDDFDNNAPIEGEHWEVEVSRHGEETQIFHTISPTGLGEYVRQATEAARCTNITIKRATTIARTGPIMGQGRWRRTPPCRVCR